MAIEKKESFVKQIVLYINKNECQMAYELALEFTRRFPSEMISHYLLAKASFWLGKYAEAAEEATKAFNLASGADLVPCAIMAASAYYQLGQYDKGYKMLDYVKTEGNEDFEKLKFAFAVSMQKENEASSIFEALLRINKNEAEKLLKRLLLG